MVLKIVKLDVSPIAIQLARIADYLEKIVEQTNPIPADWKPYDESKEPLAFYTDEREDIIREKLAAMGKEYKPSTPHR